MKHSRGGENLTKCVTCTSPGECYMKDWCRKGERPLTMSGAPQPSGPSKTEKSETTPDGKSAHELGAKLDLGKSPVFQGLIDYFPRACRATGMLSAGGARKYAWKGWEHVDDGFNRYMNAGARHLLDMGEKGLYDDEPGGTGELHLTAVVWNFMAALELQIRELEEEGGSLRVPTDG